MLFNIDPPIKIKQKKSKFAKTTYGIERNFNL